MKTEMFQYLTPSTLKEMYKDLDEARLNLLKGVNKDNMIERSAQYRKLNDAIEEIDKFYENLTGEALWVEVALEQQ